MNLGEKILKLRKDHKMSQDEFAEILNVTRQTVSNWENSKNYPDIETLIKISNSFHISLDILIKNDKDMVIHLDKNIKNTKIFRWMVIIFISLFAIMAISFIIGVQMKKIQEKKEQKKYETIILNIDKLGFEKDELGFAFITENDIIYRIFIKEPVTEAYISAMNTTFTDEEAIAVTYNGKDIKVSYLNDNKITIYCNKDGSLLTESQNRNHTDVYNKYKSRTIEIVTRIVELFESIYKSTD